VDGEDGEEDEGYERLAMDLTGGSALEDDGDDDGEDLTDAIVFEPEVHSLLRACACEPSDES
jgi:hypothetical protein